jgi:altered-inheritance-of-mitochondria protein 5
MGVTTGFVRTSSCSPLLQSPYLTSPASPQLGGFTLTSAILYLSISLHAQNRATQAALLRQQRHVLTNVYDPKELEAEPAYREVPVGLAEMAKDRWNRELEGAVKKVYGTDWRKVRESAEDRLGGLVERIREGK